MFLRIIFVQSFECICFSHIKFLLVKIFKKIISPNRLLLLNAFKILTENKTTIVIAHRLSTILNSNNIYLIDSGKVIDSGKHEDLLIKSKLYKNFYEKQIQK